MVPVRVWCVLENNLLNRDARQAEGRQSQSRCAPIGAEQSKGGQEDGCVVGPEPPKREVSWI